MKRVSRQNIRYFKRRSIRCIAIIKKRINIKSKKQSAYKIIHYETIEMPPVFCLEQDGRQNVICIIAKIKAKSKTSRYLKLDLSPIEKIDIGAITILLSVAKDLLATGIKIKGNQPKNQIARETLQKSGFFVHIHNTSNSAQRKTKKNTTAI